MTRILSAFNDYQANNNGKMPSAESDLDRLVQKYIGADGQVSVTNGKNGEDENSLTLSGRKAKLQSIAFSKAAVSSAAIISNS